MNAQSKTLTPKAYVQWAVSNLARQGHIVKVGAERAGKWNHTASYGWKSKPSSLDSLVVHLSKHSEDTPTHFGIVPHTVGYAVIEGARDKVADFIDERGIPAFLYEVDGDTFHAVYPHCGKPFGTKALKGGVKVISTDSFVIVPRETVASGWGAPAPEAKLDLSGWLKEPRKPKETREAIDRLQSRETYTIPKPIMGSNQGTSLSVRLENEFNRQVEAKKPEVREKNPDLSAKEVFKEAIEDVMVRDTDDWKDLMDLLDGLGFEFRFDMSSHREQWRWKGADLLDWTDYEDTQDKTIRCFIGDAYKVANGKRYNAEQAYWKLRLAVIVDRNQQDPFTQWLESLPEWDGVERLPTLLCDAFGAKGDLAAWGGVSIPLACVQRAYEPGCKIDESVVLVSDRQGIGKSHFCSSLFPRKVRSRWFTDCLNLTAPHKENVEAIRGRVLAELSEMGGMMKSELNKVKRFWTSQTDSVRFSYGHYETNLDRRTVFVATSDRADCLPPDSAGHRRFVPIACVRGSDVEGFLDGCRAMVWAEALARYRRGEKASLPRDLMLRQKDTARALQAIDRTLLSRLEDMLEDTPDGDYVSPKTMARYANEDFENGRWFKKYGFTGRQIADAAYSLGWEQFKHTKWNPKTKKSERLYRFTGTKRNLTKSAEPDASGRTIMSGGKVIPLDF